MWNTKCIEAVRLFKLSFANMKFKEVTEDTLNFIYNIPKDKVNSYNIPLLFATISLRLGNKCECSI